MSTTVNMLLLSPQVSKAETPALGNGPRRFRDLKLPGDAHLPAAIHPALQNQNRSHAVDCLASLFDR